MLRHLALVMPAYNEEGSLESFVPELIEALGSAAERLSVIVVDDASTDGTAERLQALAQQHPELTALRNAVNSGHGPSALRAYRAGLDTGADIVMHIDGDGQFAGSEVAGLLRALPGKDVVHGARQQRTDPWFRRVLTSALAVLVFLVTRRRGKDVNTPLRVYRAEVLTSLLIHVPEDSIVPNVHLTIAECRTNAAVGVVHVQSFPRRGGEATGTMWGEQKRPPRLPPVRLRRFVRRASGEVFGALLHRPLRPVRRSS